MIVHYFILRKLRGVNKQMLLVSAFMTIKILK